MTLDEVKKLFDKRKAYVVLQIDNPGTPKEKSHFLWNITSLHGARSLVTRRGFDTKWVSGKGYVKTKANRVLKIFPITADGIGNEVIQKVK